ncbi:MAG TPA: M56 family metallopeptidase [Pirellulales bacterium]|nr:M56 family metallopeptidase [Pirellulales bacterium]
MTTDLHPIVELACRQLWQVTLVALLAAAVLRFACHRRPQLAYLVGLVVLLKCWVPPVWSSYGGIFCWPPQINLAPASSEQSREGPSLAASASAPAIAASPTERRPDQTADAAPANVPSRPLTQAEAMNGRTVTALVFFTAWLAGAVGFLVRACVDGWRWRSGIRAVPAPDHSRLEGLVGEIAARLGLRRRPTVVVTSTSTGPGVFGLWRPTVVVPLRLLAGRDTKDLAMVLAHEMIHIRRGDLYVGVFQFATQVVWWFHPLVWCICRAVTRERERSCDEAVLAALDCPPASYAQCLLDVLRVKRRSPVLPAFPGMRAADVTQRRIEHIMRSNVAARSRTPLRYWLMAAAALCLVLPGQRLTVAMPGNPHTPVVVEAREVSPPPATDRQPSDDASTAPEEKDPPPSADAAANADGPSATGAAGNDEQPSAIDQAIDRGIRFLRGQQKADGFWPDPVGYPGGITGLCTLALLKHGIKPDDPSLRLTLAHLGPLQPSMTYSTAVQTLVFCAAGPQTHRKTIERNVEWLALQQKQQGPFTGAWGYPQARGDNSNTAFAVAALYEADRVGVKTANAVWRRTLDYYVNTQNNNGSWGYKPGLGGTGSMTSQGLYCVTAAAKVLGEDKPDQPAAKSIENAAAWLARNFRVDGNPGIRGQGWQFYYLLALAKAGRISGKARFGEHDWFDDGSKTLLNLQQLDGSWKGTGHAEDDPHLATSMAILFLLQGRDSPARAPNE